MIPLVEGLPRLPECVIGFTKSEYTHQWAPVGCNSWRCRRCGPAKTAKFLARARSVTLNWKIDVTYDDHTYRRRRRPGERPDQYINRCWRPFVRWLKRNYGARDFKETWTNEKGDLHRRDHKHALVKLSRGVHFQRARRSLKRCGLGRQFKAKPIVEREGAARYAAKYLIKAMDQEWPRYARRCQNAAPRWFEPITADIRNGDVEQCWTFEKLTSPWLPRGLSELAAPLVFEREREKLERAERERPRPPPCPHQSDLFEGRSYTVLMS